MSLLVAIQMDPIETIDIETDSTFALALEAQARGHRLFHYLPRHLSLVEGRVVAKARRLKRLARAAGKHAELGAAETIDLAKMDVILMRQDPPFDMAYITATHVLEHVSHKALVVNDPASVRNAPEKLFATHFSDLMPPTLVSSDREEIAAFRKKHNDIILKPLFGNGGAGVFRVTKGDENFNALLETFAAFYREPIVVQRYLPAVRKGDKRIILVDGEPVGAVLRVPPRGDARANLHVGAKAVRARLTRREREICHTIGPTLRDRGLLFVGIDVIGDYLTEINVTSPTGIQEINRFDATALEKLVWNAIEARL